MKFAYILFVVLLLSACVPPTHVIRINESLPKNASIEKESVVVYYQHCPQGDCSLNDKNVKMNDWGVTVNEDIRQIEFHRLGPRATCNPEGIFWKSPHNVYYVLWYNAGEPYRAIKGYCDDKSQDFKVVLLYDGINKDKEIPVLKTQDGWVVEVK